MVKYSNCNLALIWVEIPCHAIVIQSWKWSFKIRCYMSRSHLQFSPFDRCDWANSISVLLCPVPLPDIFNSSTRLHLKSYKPTFRIIERDLLHFVLVQYISTDPKSSKQATNERISKLVFQYIGHYWLELIWSICLNFSSMFEKIRLWLLEGFIKRCQRKEFFFSVGNPRNKNTQSYPHTWGQFYKTLKIVIMSKIHDSDWPLIRPLTIVKSWPRTI